MVTGQFKREAWQSQPAEQVLTLPDTATDGLSALSLATDSLTEGLLLVGVGLVPLLVLEWVKVVRNARRLLLVKRRWPWGDSRVGLHPIVGGRGWDQYLGPS